jgi:hypothetical protein
MDRAVEAVITRFEQIETAGYADPRTTRRYDRARHNLDRAAT